ncbi:hypothetical protein CDO52_23780 [Nocardiopsis gilva YIM 90087]|uniref:SdpI family protein n=1 Tax=Nocardiopsis gilva YIM 90087 TaxID=1235441 RepID=A0A223SBE5_9ACTN|nr:hypothetical protein [Nocardiopsis gilva]ASU85415.1 hypothetical protein CDO52_23780 [Nocardiopsis gilva YIM 90087]
MVGFAVVCLTGAALTAAVLIVVRTRRRRGGSTPVVLPRRTEAESGDEAWYHVHRAFAPCSSWMAGIIVVTALLAGTVPVEVLELSVLLILTGSVAVTFIWSVMAPRSPLHRRPYEYEDHWD